MPSYIALLRAVNVGGTGKLPMADLKALCEEAGFTKVKTYIASGNVVFRSSKTEAQVKKLLEGKLAAYAGKPVGVLIRTPAEMAAVVADNPFVNTAPNRTLAIFLDDPPPANALELAKNHTVEQMQLGQREIYVHYGDGMGNSRLIIPAAKTGTARNLNTIAKLAELAAGI
jgi:uncharacterized protein (DUF1697 family)